MVCSFFVSHYLCSVIIYCVLDSFLYGGDFVLGAILLSGIFLVRGIRKKERWYKVALYEIELVAWIVVWFYIGWGMNYFRQNIYERASVEKQKFNEEVFNHFLSDYL